MKHIEISISCDTGTKSVGPFFEEKVEEFLEALVKAGFIHDMWAFSVEISPPDENDY